MIYIQRVRNNDIGDDYGKQVELGKMFMSNHKWEAGTIFVTITFCALTPEQKDLDGIKLRTSFKVRGDERGGERIGVDCKEYANENHICVLKQFLTERLHLIPGKDYFILEDIGSDGKSFKLYGVHGDSVPATLLLDKFKGQIIEMDEQPKEENEDKDRPFQLIYYGAPGTGKSHTISKTTNPRNSVRTTFHPDSDYASFVGAYKPTMDDVPITVFDGTTPKFAAESKEHPGTQQKIVYKYVPQAFLKAYVAAWKAYAANTPYYLIIEEINRGNCAQIFGDLFQLLDRSDDGYSSYPINADNDIRKFLNSDEEEGFKGLELSNPDSYSAIKRLKLLNDNGEVVINGDEILSGKKLLLPPNLYIWATMNTSDQSLFPIDSAFKRRWNWEYMPIEYDKKDWYIQVGELYYSWGRFLELINPEILGLTGSADKQMGFFFTKPDVLRDGQKDRDIISEKLFINKVLFYLWTDVLKDYDLSKKPFVYEEDGKKKAFSFTDFFGKNATENLKHFFSAIEGLETTNIGEPSDKNDGAFTVTFPDGIIINQSTLTSTYMESLKKIGFDRVAKVSEEKGYKNPLVTQKKVEGLVKPRRYNEIDGWYVLVGPDTYPYYTKLEMLSDELNLNLDIKHK